MVIAIVTFFWKKIKNMYMDKYIGLLFMMQFNMWNIKWMCHRRKCIVSNEKHRLSEDGNNELQQSDKSTKKKIKNKLFKPRHSLCVWWMVNCNSTLSSVLLCNAFKIHMYTGLLVNDSIYVSKWYRNSACKIWFKTIRGAWKNNEIEMKLKYFCCACWAA